MTGKNGGEKRSRQVYCLKGGPGPKADFGAAPSAPPRGAAAKMKEKGRQKESLNGRGF